ncbi:MAG: hypothetical protein IGR92_08670 [Leptolyngbyaceae cyanobacterium T60_A2020_046]|nr:hypothetical protein [Leptolyngbyaceae cyanobacterium T60_A2020_046]
MSSSPALMIDELNGDDGLYRIAGAQAISTPRDRSHSLAKISPPKRLSNWRSRWLCSPKTSAATVKGDRALQPLNALDPQSSWSASRSGFQRYAL